MAEKIPCDCGDLVSEDRMKQHQGSKKHREAMAGAPPPSPADALAQDDLDTDVVEKSPGAPRGSAPDDETIQDIDVSARRGPIVDAPGSTPGPSDVSSRPAGAYVPAASEGKDAGPDGKRRAKRGASGHEQERDGTAPDDVDVMLGSADRREDWIVEGLTRETGTGFHHRFSRYYWNAAVLIDRYDSDRDEVKREVADKSRAIVSYNADHAGEEGFKPLGYVPMVVGCALSYEDHVVPALRGRVVPLVTDRASAFNAGARMDLSGRAAMEDEAESRARRERELARA